MDPSVERDRVEGKFLDLAQKDGVHLSESHTVARHILGIWHIGLVPVALHERRDLRT